MSRVLAGRRSVLEALRGHTKVQRVYIEATDRHEDVRQLAVKRGVQVKTKDRKALDKLAEGVRHQGIVALAEPYRFADLADLTAHAPEDALIVALDEVTDPQNLGAIVRSAVTLGVDGIVLQKHRAAGITAAVVRASAGATEHATIARVTNLQRALLTLRDGGMEVIGLDAGSDINIRDLSGSCTARVLVVGSEGKGLRRMVRQRCDIVVQIPQEGPMDSLNASVAAAIAMYELTAKRQETNDR